jgi:hypothetical protein
MQTRRMRIARHVREEIEITVHFRSGIKPGSYDSYEELFEAARRAGHTVKECINFDAISQYGYVHPDDEPADATVSSDGIDVSPDT